MSLHLTEKSGGYALAVKVVPGSSRHGVAGEYAGGIKVNVREAPEAGAANKAVIALLAEVLGIPDRNVQILRGHSSARKEIRILGLSEEEIRERLKSTAPRNRHKLH